MKGSPNNAKTCALKLLSYRSRSNKEIIEKLKRKGFGDAEISNTVHFLENAGLINDEILAIDIYKHSADRKPLGKKGIEALLSRRGIGNELINKTLSHHTRDTEEESAKMLVGKKLKSLKSQPEDIVKRRLWGMLQRRGFSIEVINKVIRDLFSNS